MRKIAVVLIALVFTVASSVAEVYRFDYLAREGRVDYMSIKNQSQIDLRIRLCIGSCCTLVSVPSGKTEEVGINFYNGRAIVIPVQFECRVDGSGESVSVMWLMDNRGNDINVTLLPDEGWHF